MKSGQVDVFDLPVGAGQFVEITVEQLGINVRATLMNSGEEIFQSDNHRGMRGIEQVCAIAESAAQLQLKVEAVRDHAVPGKYRVLVVALRAAIAADQTRIAAQAIFAEADLLRQKPKNGDEEKARAMYQQALKQWELVGDLPRQALALRKISALSSKLGSLPGQIGLGRAAVEEGERAVNLYRLLGDRSGEAHSIYTIAEALRWAVKEIEPAREHYEVAARISREIGEQLVEGLALRQLGVLARERGERQKAADILLQSLTLLQPTGEHNDAVSSFTELLKTCELLDDKSKVVSTYKQARQLYLQTGDPKMAAIVLDDLGKQAASLKLLSLANISVGKVQEAIEQSQASVRIWRELGNRAEEAAALQTLAEIYREAGDKLQAAEICEQATQLFHTIKDCEGELKTLLLSANIHHLIGGREGYQEALDRLNQAVALSRDLAKPNYEAVAMSLFAETYRAIGNRKKGIEAHLRGLELARVVGDRPLEAVTLHNIGWAYLWGGEREKALDYHNQSLRLYLELGDLVGQANALRGLGRTYALMGQARKGIELHRQAIELTQMSNEPVWESIALYGLALLQSNAGQLQPARESMEQVLKLHEAIRANLLNWELRATYLASSRKYYELYVDLLMRLHQQDNGKEYDRLAFEASENSRARSLLELLTEARADLRQGVPADLVKLETRLLEQVNVKLLALKTASQPAEQFAALNRQISLLRMDLRQVRDEIYKTNPRLRAIAEARPRHLVEVQQQLDADTLLLEYALGSERSYLWVVSADSLKTFELPKAEIINQQARAVHRLLSNQQPQKQDETRDDWRKRAEEAVQQFPAAADGLSRTLFAPIAPLLGQKRLVIVADGALQYVPFGALTIDSRPLIADHEIVNLPSASTISLLRMDSGQHLPATNSVAILADPVFAETDERLKRPAGKNIARPASAKTHDDLTLSARETGATDVQGNWGRLRYSGTEAQNIQKAAAGKFKLAIGFNATRQFAMSGALNQHRIIHFATHSLVNNRNPEWSGIVLSLIDQYSRPQNGFLRLHDIYNLKLSADLVVLSACQTALGQEINGEGLIGLTRGFMYAGSPRVIASLYNVNDRTTAELMKRFYTGLLGPKHLSPAAALRAAQISMWRDSNQSLNDAYNWAGFVIQGEWR